MSIRNAVLVLGTLSCCLCAAAQEDRYRVAGTVLMPQGRSTAIIERTPGDTITVAVGDALDAGRVSEISERYVRVSFPGRDLLLPLSGGPAEIVATARPPAQQPTEGATTTRERADLYAQRVPAKQLLFAIDELSVRLQREGFTGNSKESGRDLARLLEGPIGFPEGTVIREINGQSFSSVAEGLEIVESLLAIEQPAALRFALAGDSARPLYVFPQ